MVTLSLQSQFNFDAETDVPLTLEDKKVRGGCVYCLPGVHVLGRVIHNILIL